MLSYGNNERFDSYKDQEIAHLKEIIQLLERRLALKNQEKLPKKTKSKELNGNYPTKQSSTELIFNEAMQITSHCGVR